MKANSYTDPVTGVILSDDEARRAGAQASMRALAQLKNSAEGYSASPSPASNRDAAEEFYEHRINDAKAFSEAIGPLSPFQEGAVLALAEYLHEYFTTGEADLDRRNPCAAMTANQYRDEVERLASAMEDE
jgi:hypothetical protein